MSELRLYVFFNLNEHTEEEWIIANGTEPPRSDVYDLDEAGRRELVNLKVPRLGSLGWEIDMTSTGFLGLRTKYLDHIPSKREAIGFWKAKKGV